MLFPLGLPLTLRTLLRLPLSCWGSPRAEEAARHNTKTVAKARICIEKQLNETVVYMKSGLTHLDHEKASSLRNMLNEKNPQIL